MPHLFSGIVLVAGVTLGVTSSVIVFAAVGDFLTRVPSNQPLASVGLVIGIFAVVLIGTGWVFDPNKL